MCIFIRITSQKNVHSRPKSVMLFNFLSIGECELAERKLPHCVIDITGQKFGRLTAKNYESGKWHCDCECGGKSFTQGKKLRSGHSRSCGCLSTERIAKLNRVNRYLGVCECGDHAFAELTRGYVGLLSPEDKHLFEQYSWNAHRNPRGAWSVTGTYAKKLHRVALGKAAEGKAIDHKDGNPFDNRRQNIRICSQAENCRNTKLRTTRKYSVFKGVTKCNAKRKWVAQISANKKHVFRGDGFVCSGPGVECSDRQYWADLHVMLLLRFGGFLCVSV